MAQISKETLMKAQSLIQKGDFASARAVFEAAPKTPDLQFEFSRFEILLGRHADAWELLAPLVAAHPKEAGLWVEVARIARSLPEAAHFISLKRTEMPVPLWQLVKAVKSGEGLSLPRLKGETARVSKEVEALLAQKKAKNALALLQQKADVKNPAFLLLKVRVFMLAGNMAGAEGLLQQLLKALPFTQEVLRLTAELQLRKGQGVHAAQTARKCAEMAPKSAETVVQAVRLLVEQSHFIAARAVLEESKAMGLPNAQYLYSEANVLMAEGYPLKAAEVLAAKAKSFEAYAFVAQAYNAARRTQEALSFFDLALSKKRDASLLVEQAQLLQTVGESERADRILTEVLLQEPSHGRAFRAYCYGGKRALSDPLVEAALKMPPKNAEARSLHYGAAKVGFDAKDHGFAWQHLNQANEQTGALFPYGAEADQQTAVRLKGAVSDSLKAQNISATQKADPIFVTGMPRSGTTLVEQILGAHSHVQTGGELGVAGMSLEPLISALAEGTPLGVADFDAASEAYLARAAQKLPDNAPRFTDKSINNFASLGVLQAVLPRARFVVVRRDPRDVALSIYRNQFPDGNQRYAANLEQIADYYKLFESFLAHWKAFGVDFYEISYEALVSDPQAQTRRLLEACALPWEEQCLAFHENRNARIETLSFAQARAPINQSSKGGWKQHEAQLLPFIQRAEAIGLTLGPASA